MSSAMNGAVSGTASTSTPESPVHAAPSLFDDAADVAAITAAAGGSSSAGPSIDPALRRAARDALARIYDRHAPVVRAVCLVHLHNAAMADDALQETFVRLARTLDRVHTPEAGGVRRWLCGIAANVCAEMRRAGARRAHREKVAHAAHATPRTSDTTPPIDALAKAERLHALTLALADLPEDQRAAIHMYYLDADPVDSAQRTLGVSRSAFYRLLHAARATLAARLNAAPSPASTPEARA